METELRNFLKTKVPTDINWGWHVEGSSYPYATLAHRFTQKEYTQSGPAGLKRYSIDLSVWSQSYKEATNLTIAYEKALDEYSDKIVIDEIRIETDSTSAEIIVRGSIRFHIWV